MALEFDFQLPMLRRPLFVSSMTLDFDQFVRENTELRSTELIPEVKLHLVGELLPLWHATDAAGVTPTGEPPFWAFAWIGGQAMTRFILDHPDEVRGLRVFDFATGSGLSGIAAALAGAAYVKASDIDVLACCATRLNAAANSVDVQVVQEDVIGSPMDDFDVILAGDICYEAKTAKRVHVWLEQLWRSGKRVILGDPGRAYFPYEAMECLARYSVPTTTEVEAVDLRAASVWTFKAEP
jgi:predicted nicotinamide N-methyase